MKLAALFVLLSSFAWAGSAWEGRLAEARKAALAERKKLGLTDDKLRASYPTPEVQFGAQGGAVGVVCPGKSTVVKGHGKWKAGTTVVPRSDEVEVSASAGSSYEATVKVKPGTLPGPVEAEVAAAVSFTSATVPFVFVGCAHQWRIELSNGEVLLFKTDWSKAGPLALEGEWTRGGKAEGKMKYQIEAESPGHYALERNASPDERMGEANAVMGAMSSKEYLALQKRQEAEMKKFDVCAKLPPEKMGECMKAPGEAIKVISSEMEALMKKAQAAALPAFGCASLRVQVEGGNLSGEASACVGEARAKITGGTVTAL